MTVASTLGRPKAPARLRWRLVLCCVLLGLAGFGCKKEGAASGGKAGIFVGPNEKTFDALLPDDVLVAVNGVPLKRRDCDAMLNRMERTYQVANPNVTAPLAASYRKSKARSIVPEFVTKQLFVQEARRRNLAPTPENLAKADALLAKRAKWEKKSPEEFLRTLSELDAAAIRADLADQALIFTLRENQFGERLAITEKDMQEARDRIAEYNRRGEATNALVMARGAAICERLRKGEDFLSVAAEVTQDEEFPDGVWGEFARGEIENVQVRHAAFTLPVGAVSEPFDTEEGLVIIKVLARTGIDSPVAKESAVVKLGRIVLLLWEFKTVPDDETLRKELERRRLEELQRDWIKGLREQARIEYPNGTNFWKKAAKK